SESTSITRPSGARWSSVGSVSASQVRPVTSNSAPRRLEAVSSGPITRKLSPLRRMTSRRKPPSTRVASLVAAAGSLTATACSRKSGISRSRSSRPPLAWGLAPMRRSPAGARGRQRGELAAQRSALVEELLGAVGAQPLLELSEVLGLGGEVCERHLVGAEGALGGEPVDLLGPGPALGRAQHDHRPARPRRVSARARPLLDLGDLLRDLVERGRHQLVHAR